MTAKVLATLGALGLILTIWTADFRFLWTEGIAFTVPIFLIMALALITGYAIGFTHNHRSQ